MSVFKLVAVLLVVICPVVVWAVAPEAGSEREGFTTGRPPLESMGALEIGPDGTLFIGDSRAGAVFAVDLGDNQPHTPGERLEVNDLEGKIGAMLGARPADVLLHDMAVNPVSANTYLSVSRGRGKWASRWALPNELEDASILLRITPAGEIEDVPLEDVQWARARLPNPVAADKKHSWKPDAMLRTDTITDLALAGENLYVTGLSNEEFAAAMWRIPFPFAGPSSTAALEIFHGAHGVYETHAPIRTFLPFQHGGQSHFLAAYLCTPLVTFSGADINRGGHVKGRTVAEFGSGNYPLDMVSYRRGGRDYVLMANSMLPALIFDPNAALEWKEEITSEVADYTAGLPYEVRSTGQLQQLDNYTDSVILAITRTPQGTLDLISLPVERL